MKRDYISDFELEQYLLQELPEKRHIEIDALVNSVPELKERLETLKESNREILKSHPPEIMTKSILEKTEGGNEDISESAPSRNYFIPAMAAASLLFGFLFLFQNNMKKTIQHKGITNTDRIKGERANLYIYRKAPDGGELLVKGAPVAQGDVLQLAYRVEKNYFGTIFSVDGTGVMTVHFPERGESQQLKHGKKVFLSTSYELDDAPEFENFYLVHSDKKIDLKRVAEIVKSSRGKSNMLGKILIEALPSIKLVEVPLKKK